MDEDAPIVVGEDAIEFPVVTEHVDENGNTVTTGYEGGGSIPISADPPPPVVINDHTGPEGV